MRIKIFPVSLKSNIKNYLLLQISFYASILCFIGVFINFFHRTETALIITTLIPALVFLSIYLIGRFKPQIKVSKQILIIGLLIVANTEWFVTYGSKGNMIMLFLLIELLIFVFTESWKRYLYIFITILNVLVLLYLEYLNNDLITYATNDTTLKIDLGISFILFSIALYMIIRLAIKEYISQKNRWKNIFQAIGQPAFILTPNQILTEINEAAIKASGKQKHELIGMHCYQLFHDSKSSAPPKGCPLAKMKISKKIETKEMEVEFLNGTYMVTCTPVFINDELDHIIHIATDISEQKKTKDELLFAKEKAEESDLLKSAFLANMSHEIRTPMNGILGFADLLKDPQLSEKKLVKYVNIIEKSGQRMLNIINDLIDISKIESNQMNLVISDSKINEQLQYLYSFFQTEAKKKNLKLNLLLPDLSEDLVLKTDKEKLFAILTNLIKNAIKYTNIGFINFGYKIKKQSLEFFVKDTGIGIQKEKLETIFDRFVQADLSITKPYEGAGLGLAITKAYVEMLGGKIEVNSEFNVGSEFFFSLPYLPKKPIPAEKITLQNKNENTDIQKKLNILIAEDEAFSDYYLSELLKNDNFKLIHAKNGQEAIEICRENKNIDLVLMDIKMPVIDGYQATKEIRKFNTNVVIIAQTAYALVGDKQNALDAGCNDYLSKPIKKSELYQLISLYL